MKWAVEIQKTSLDRRNLVDLLDGLGFALVDGIQFPTFTSPDFENCETPADVFDRAKKLRAAFTGPAQVDPEFTLGSVIDLSAEPPNRHAFAEVEPAVVTVAVRATIGISPPKELSADDLKRWEADRAEREYQNRLEGQRARLEPAFRSARAAKVLELLSIENPSGATLYKVYELAEEHPKNRNAFLAQFGIPLEEFRRFQDAVHNPRVSGDWARHAYEDTPRTSNPMSRAEAEHFVRQLAAKWLDFVRTHVTP